MARIDYEQRTNYLSLEIAEKMPFHAKVMAELSGLTVQQVYYRLRQKGISLRDIRNGEAGIGKKIKDKYVVENTRIAGHHGNKRKCG